MKQRSSIASKQITFDWMEPDARTLAALAGECVESVNSLPKDGTVVLVSCGRNKRKTKAPAAELYTSSRFQLSREFAERLGLRYFIVSAKHGLVAPDRKIEPYDQSLEALNDEQRVAWTDGIVNGLLSLSQSPVRVVLLADEQYAAPLRVALEQTNIAVTQPLENLSKETGLALLKQCSRFLDRTDAVKAFYALFEEWGTKSAILPLRDALQKPMPEQGVYFFFDPEEETQFSSVLGRLVRIGTHGVSAGSKATLRDRLRTHLGTADGYGNHRSSVFRLHIGEAMIRRDGLRKRFPQWGSGQNSSALVRERERPLEKLVSSAISKLCVAVVEVSDRAMKTSARAVIETSAIALFTEDYQPVESPGSQWLGRHSAHELISKTGLWNLRDVGSKADLDIVKALCARLQ